MHFLLVMLLAQGPTPETAASMFPGGAYVSYNSVFSARASRPHDGVFAFAVGLRRDLQFSAEIPVTTSKIAGVNRTGLGESAISMKYRFLRMDSARGTTQASVSLGPRFASSVTEAPLDVFINGSFTYTGLFNIRKLVADVSTDYFPRNDEIDARLWLSYRPYQSQSVGSEWWIGPSVTWQQNVIDRGTVAPGAVTYISPVAGTVFWAGIEFPDGRRRLSFGVTRQFIFPR
jgi:hypothetical protein